MRASDESAKVRRVTSEEAYTERRVGFVGVAATEDTTLVMR